MKGSLICGCGREHPANYPVGQSVVYCECGKETTVIVRNKLADYSNWLLNRNVDHDAIAYSDNPDELFRYIPAGKSNWVYIDQDEYENYK